jgi:F-type H+-transporting ATPase subunit epsilon
MAKKTFHCKLVTPAAAVVDDQVTYASVPCWDGLQGILPGRAPLLAKLGIGELRLDFADAGKAEGGSRAFLIEGGFVKMAENELTILAEKATPSESLTLAEAEADLKRSQGAGPVAGETAAARQVEQDKRSRDRQRARVKMHLVKSRNGI